MGKGHDHTEDGLHGHSHAPADFGNAFLIGIVLNTVFVIVEAAYGWISGSMALIADAGHNLSDVLALLLAWGASIAAKRCHMGHVLMDRRSALVEDVDLTEANGTAERESALRMLARNAPKAKSKLRDD